MARCTQMHRSRWRRSTARPARLLGSGGETNVMVRLVTGLKEGRSVVRRNGGSPAFAGPSARGVRSSSVPSQHLRPSPCSRAVWEALSHDGRTRIRPTRVGMTFRLGSRP